MLTDLRKTNSIIQPMGALQQGLPSPAMIPKNWHIIIIDLKDYFFTIPLQPADGEKFAFTVPALNNSRPAQRYQWKVLPRGMFNSPTLCQHFVNQLLQLLRKDFPQAYITHYMHDVLFTCSSEQQLTSLYSRAEIVLQSFSLIIAGDKVQKNHPFSYLGLIIDHNKITPQKVQLRTDKLQT